MYTIIIYACAGFILQKLNSIQLKINICAYFDTCIPGRRRLCNVINNNNNDDVQQLFLLLYERECARAAIKQQFRQDSDLNSFRYKRTKKNKISLQEEAKEVKISEEDEDEDDQSRRGAFSIASPSVWNSLPQSLRLIDDHEQFRKQLKIYYFNIAFS